MFTREGIISDRLHHVGVIRMKLLLAVLFLAVQQASAACTLWPGRNEAAWRACMELERQQQQIQRLQSEQWLLQQQQQQPRIIIRPNKETQK
jgi:hypothetical protein